MGEKFNCTYKAMRHKLISNLRLKIEKRIFFLPILSTVNSKIVLLLLQSLSLQMLLKVFSEEKDDT